MTPLDIFLKTSITENSSEKIHKIALLVDTDIRIYDVIIYHLTKTHNQHLLKYYKEKRTTCLTILENITNNKSTNNNSIDIAAKHNIITTHINNNSATIHKQVMYHLNHEFNTVILGALENRNTSHETLSEIESYYQYKHLVIQHPNYSK